MTSHRLDHLQLADHRLRVQLLTLAATERLFDSLPRLWVVTELLDPAAQHAVRHRPPAEPEGHSAVRTVTQ